MVARKIDDFVAWYEVFRRDQGKRALSDADRKSYARHMQIIILDLLAAWEGDPSKFIGYSRGGHAFRPGGSYWDPTTDESILSERIFIGLIDFLSAVDLIENHVIDAGFQNISSRMRASEALVNQFRERGLNWTSIAIDPNAEVIFVNKEYETGNKDKYGNKIVRKRYIPLPKSETFDLEQARANLRRINTNLQSTFINLDVTDETLAAIRARWTDDEDEGPEPREPFEHANRTLRRIFSETYENGGRFYGGWWQGIPSEYRKFIEIDGAMTREMDFSSMQPRLMYAEVGQKPPKDAYALPDWHKEVRPYAKKAFNQIINSDKSSRHESQWRRFAPDLSPIPKPANWNKRWGPDKDKIRCQLFLELFGRPYTDLIRDLLGLHKPIDEFFFSKAWGPMQRRDSDIAERTMLKLLDRDVPITALPIHDSFIVRRGGEDALFAAMAEAFEEVTGTPGDIDLEEAVYDAPDDYEGPRLVRVDQKFIGETKEWIINSPTYHRREHEWEMANGPID